MNSSQSKSRRSDLAAAVVVAALMLAASPGITNSVASAAGKALDVEIPFDIKPLKAAGITAPYFLTAKDGKMIVSDQAGGVFAVTFDGKATPLADKAKLKSPAGVAVAPAGFGAYTGQVFVLNSAGGDKAPCEVDRIDGSGAVSTFAKLPDAAGAPATCRGLEFGPAGSPYAGKLYAATSANSTLYSIDASGKAAVLGTYKDPVPFELTTIGFAPASDPKAPGQMLVGMRASLGSTAKVGRIAVIGPDGKAKDPYLVGFTRPSGFGKSPENFGTYGDEFFIADAGRYFSENNGARDGLVLRVDKGFPRTYASGLMDPTDLKFIGNKMVICDPAEKGKGAGAILIISSMM